MLNGPPIEGPIAQPPQPTGHLAELVLYFLRLGAFGFGGPVALVGQMERELVVERGWLSKDQMREAIAVCQSLPGARGLFSLEGVSGLSVSCMMAIQRWSGLYGETA
jgi:hypothetical protein